MKKVHILYFNFISRDNKIDIGGIETYMQLLSKALCSQYTVEIYFPAAENYTISTDTFRAHGVLCPGINALQKIVYQKFADKEDTIILATDQITPVIPHPRIIGIQHGIYWDLPAGIYRKYKNRYLLRSLKLFDNYRNYRRSGKFRRLICVDYNFLNWKRTLSRELDEKNYRVILNCAADRFFEIQPADIRNHHLTILFPRRFVKLRGCLMFVRVVSKLMATCQNFRVIIAGEGPLEDEMKRILPPGEKVHYTSTSYQEMPELIMGCDVVVIPSLGSEGSSLAVIEGMSAGRMVVASNTGGINNLIISGFNGLLCSPEPQSFYTTLEKVITEPSRFGHLPGNARLTAESAFRFRDWAEAWQNCIAELYE